MSKDVELKKKEETFHKLLTKIKKAKLLFDDEITTGDDEGKLEDSAEKVFGYWIGELTAPDEDTNESRQILEEFESLEQDIIENFRSELESSD